MRSPAALTACSNGLHSRRDGRPAAVGGRGLMQDEGVTTIEGEVAAGFEPVRAAFAANFARHGDVGAAVCVYQNGRPVVDLWGGLADPDGGRPWARETLQLVYSATKGATAAAAHLLAQRGALDLDVPVAN